MAVVVSFFICWLPFHAQRLLASYLVKDENQNQFLLDIYLKLTYISGVMYYLSSTVNPLLYQLMSAKFRLAFKETFKCSLFKCAIFRRRLSGGNGATSAAPTSAQRGPHDSPSNSMRANGSANHESTTVSCCQCNAAQSQQRPLPSSEAYQFTPDRSSQAGDTMQWPSNGAKGSNAASLVDAGLLTRVRGRLNSSLGSLLNIAGGANNRCPQLKLRCCPNCPLRSTHRLGLTKRLQRNFRRSFRSEYEASSANSTPLLCPVHRDNRGQANGSQQKQRARTMLKFIRSPTPSSQNCTPNGQLVGLTRLSSREDDETDSCAAPAGHEGKMNSLIRAKCEDEEEADDEELLVSSTTGSRTQSSAGCSLQSSSPDQREQQLQSGCLAATATGSSELRECKAPPDVRACRQQQQQQQTAAARQTIGANLGQRRRRLSLQQQSNDSNASSSMSAADNLRQQRSGQSRRQQQRFESKKQQKQRRKSSSLCQGNCVNSQEKTRNTATNNNNDGNLINLNSGPQQRGGKRQQQQLSSSLSSSEKYLTLDGGKKLSFSTTTSGAVDDCASFTSSALTNSQHHLNIIGGEVQCLAAEVEAEANNEDVNNSDSQEIEEEPSTAIDAHQSTSDFDERHADEDCEEEEERQRSACCNTPTPAQVAPPPPPLKTTTAG